MTDTQLRAMRDLWRDVTTAKPGPVEPEYCCRCRRYHLGRTWPQGSSAECDAERFAAALRGRS